MTQDQYSQPRGPGYVVRDDVVPDDENEEVTDESKPMTRFQKVASALRGDRADQDEADQDQLTANQGTIRSQAATDSDAMVQNPVNARSGRRRPDSAITGTSLLRPAPSGTRRSG